MSAISTSSSHRLRVGQRVGQYRIDGVLGEGGMGVVYRARDRKLRRTVAIKVVDRADTAARRSLLQEARIAASLDHPAICAVHEVGCVGDQPFVVMEHVAGLPLSSVIPQGRGLELEAALHYGLAVRQPVDLDETATETTRSEMPSGAGTVPYMAPELLRGRRADRRSD